MINNKKRFKNKCKKNMNKILSNGMKMIEIRMMKNKISKIMKKILNKQQNNKKNKLNQTINSRRLSKNKPYKI